MYQSEFSLSVIPVPYILYYSLSVFPHPSDFPKIIAYFASYCCPG
uniref:Uncharacterized protein n=1 Tax=Arundo donax TaxID=35708 RepID=A0A0A9A386_ARUDO